MELDPKARNLLNAIAAAGTPPVVSLPVEIARETVSNGMARMKIPVAEVKSVENKIIVHGASEIPVRIYHPTGEPPYRVVVFFHGGGWVLFRPEDYDPLCTHLCHDANCLVYSVDYRLSPEYRFPVALNECYDATVWIAGHCHQDGGDPGQLFLMGDSAGGNLAAATAMKIRDENGPKVKGQILVYPVTDHYSRKKLSAEIFSAGFNLSDEDMHWFWDMYLENPQDADHPYASPLIAKDHSGLPDTLILVSGYDTLRDDGLEYAEKLKISGVPVNLIIYREMIHGFLSYLGILDQGKKAIKEISDWIG